MIELNGKTYLSANNVVYINRIDNQWYAVTTDGNKVAITDAIATELQSYSPDVTKEQVVDALGYAPVKSVNSNIPDEDGDVAITIPDAVTANPTLVGTETVLAGLQIGDTKYKAPNQVEAITPAGTDPTLSGVRIAGTDYKVGGGAEVHLYQHRLHFEAGLSNNNYFTYDLIIYTTTAEKFTKTTLINYWYNITGSRQFPVVGGQVYASVLASALQMDVGYRFVITSNNNDIQAMYYNASGNSNYKNISTFYDYVDTIF